MNAASRPATMHPATLCSLSVLLAFVSPARPGADEATGPDPACHAAKLGARLTTTAVFADGYMAQARWRVLDFGSAEPDPSGGRDAVLQVESVMEGSIETTWREHKRFDPPFLLRLVRPGPDVALDAAQSWCRIVETLRRVSPAAPVAALGYIT